MLLELENALIVGKSRFLFLSFGLKDDKFSLDFRHMRFIGTKKIMFMLFNYFEEFLIIIS